MSDTNEVDYGGGVATYLTLEKALKLSDQQLDDILDKSPVVNTERAIKLGYEKNKSEAVIEQWWNYGRYIRPIERDILRQATKGHKLVDYRIWLTDGLLNVMRGTVPAEFKLKMELTHLTSESIQFFLENLATTIANKMDADVELEQNYLNDYTLRVDWN